MPWPGSATDKLDPKSMKRPSYLQNPHAQVHDRSPLHT